MDKIIEVRLDKNLEKNDSEYFFTLLGERFDYLNKLWTEELKMKFQKRFKPIFILNAKRNKFFPMANYILLNEKLYKLQKKLNKKKIIFQSEADDLNREFSNSKFVKTLINKLITKQGRIFILSWTSAGLFFSNPKVKILGPASRIVTKYDSKIEHALLFKKLNLPRIEAKICKNFSEVEQINKNFYPFFLSANLSSGGQESKIIQAPKDLVSFFPWLRTINRNDKFLVSKLIKKIIFAPNTSAIVIGRNRTEMVCVSDQILHGTKYVGNIFPSKISVKNKKFIIDATKKIGSLLSQIGFRGLFGCDFLIDARNNCYITDLNPRRQGGYLCNVLMLLSKGVNIIETELKLALNEKVDSLNLQDFSLNYAWAHSKVKPHHTNYKILSLIKSGEPADPFLKPGSIFKMTFFPKNYLYGAGAPGYCIVSGNSRKTVIKRINKITKEMADKCFKPDKELPEDYFENTETLNFLQGKSQK